MSTSRYDRAARFIPSRIRTYVPQRQIFPAIAASISPHAYGHSSEQVNEANNPPTPKITLNVQDQRPPDLYDVPDDYVNSVLFRGVLPHKLGGLPQILRFSFTLPA